MTFILSLQGRKSIWLCADRRLTYPDRFIDTGMKILSIDGKDGCAFLGYAGLGASKSKTEPSAWMNDILKDKHGLSIEEQLGLIANAMKADLPRHLPTIAGKKFHALIATAIIKGTVKLYQLSVSTSPSNPIPHLIYTRHEKSSGAPVPFAVTGSGAEYLLRRRKGWHRELLRVVNAVEAGRVKPRAVADRLAAINEMVALQDPMVSKKCVVIWSTISGGSQFYDGRSRVEEDTAIPAVSNGMDVQEIAKAIIPIALESFADIRAGGEGKMDKVTIQAAIDREYNRPIRKL